MTMAVETEHQSAIADLIGALCYGLLRSFEVTAHGAAEAPTVELAERQAEFAVEELERYRHLRARLTALTGDPESALQAFRSPLDAFYDGARAQGWLGTQVFNFVGDTITTDFADILASRLDSETAKAVRHSLTGRTEQEAFALAQIGDALREEGEAAQERIATFAGTIVGHGLNRLREAVLESDALEVVLGGDAAVKECVLEILGRHRERLERLGVDRLD